MNTECETCEHRLLCLTANETLCEQAEREEYENRYREAQEDDERHEREEEYFRMQAEEEAKWRNYDDGPH